MCVSNHGGYRSPQIISQDEWGPLNYSYQVRCLTRGPNPQTYLVWIHGTENVEPSCLLRWLESGDRVAERAGRSLASRYQSEQARWQLYR
jgi:hypothetical protein